MGRRSRKRSSARPESASGAQQPPGARRPPAALRSRRDQAPPAPWGRFPLVELCVLLALVIGILGFTTGGNRGRVELVTAAALGSLSGLEISIREHFGGFRSHSMVLAGALAVVISALVGFAVPASPRWAVLIVAVGVFAGGAWALHGVFRRRTGGFATR